MLDTAEPARDLVHLVARTVKNNVLFTNSKALKFATSSNTDTSFAYYFYKVFNVYLIETVAEIKEIDSSGIDSVGIMAGASTPKESINEVKDYLEKLT